MGEVKTRLAAARLVTLTGVGGSGKTRLALEVARAVLDRYPDGAWLAELAALSDAALVPQTVGAVLDLRETPGHPIATELAQSLRGRRLLLVLDNCEHLLDACAQLVDFLLRACPELRVLATSREALGITGEIVWRVPSLPVPDLQQLPPPAALGHNPSVQLFVQRSAAVQPDFVLSERNANAVALVCHRLDGIPLALELAAARIEALTVDQLSARLDQRFRLLTGGSRTAQPRQQTLRATLDWSYDLIGEPEQHLFNRLSVFAGGWTLEAAEAVCSGNGVEHSDVLDLLQRLVRKSLVVVGEGGDRAARYRLLETLRQYACERLTAAGEADAVRDRHATWYLEQAEEAEPQFVYREWFNRLSAEQDNLRAALRWFSESNAVAQMVRLAGALWRQWVLQGNLAEGRAQLRGLLALPGLSHTSSDWARLAFCDAILAFVGGDCAAARLRLEETVAVRRTLGDRRGLAVALSYLGNVVREQAEFVAAQRWLEESLALSEELGDRGLSAETLDRLGTVAHALGDYRLARVRYDQALALAEQMGNLHEQPWSLHNLACLALDQGDYPAARACLAKSLGLRPEWDKLGLVHALAEFAVLAAAEGLPAAAMRLAGAAAALTERTGIPIQYTERGRYEHWLASSRVALGEDRAAAAWAEGQKMRLDRALAYALAPGESVVCADSAPSKPRYAHTADRLTLRERDVAALVAQGRSNREIAEALVITERTVAAHVEHILNKLGFSSRTQIGVWAAEHGLAMANRA